MSDEDQNAPPPGPSERPSRPQGAPEGAASSGEAADNGRGASAHRKPKMRIGPKNRRGGENEANPSDQRPPQPSHGNGRRPDRQGDPSGRRDNAPRPQAGASDAEGGGGIRRKRRRRNKGRRTPETPTDSVQPAIRQASPTREPLPSLFGSQVLPPIEEDLDEVPSGIFATNDLTDQDSGADDSTVVDSDVDDTSSLEGILDESSLPDASNADGGGAPSSSENRRDRKRRKKRRERQELPPVDRSSGYWWAEQWVRSFEMLFPSNASRSRLSKGRTYARRGQVLELEVGPNGVLARVQGSRPRPYQVRLELNRLRRETWGRILYQLVGKATFLAQLLEGHLPPEIEEVFFSAGARLFPHGDADIRVRCNCPDPVVPCKHVAALNYSLADALQRDPFLLFALRGKGRDQFLQDLRDMRGRDQRVNAPVVHADEDLSEFWRMGRLAESVLRPTGWSLGNDPARLLQSLGEPQLEGIREGLFLPLLEATYRQVAESMRRLPKDA